MSMDEHKVARNAGHPAGSAGHEERDVTFRPIVWAGAGALVVIGLVFVLVRLVYLSDVAHEAMQNPPANPLTGSYGRQLPPEPRLQTRPVQDLKALHAAEDSVLNSYGWVDRQAGIVRIPIARAMELLAQRGVPSEPETGGHR
jgi:hypothetical protein